MSKPRFVGADALHGAVSKAKVIEGRPKVGPVIDLKDDERVLRDHLMSLVQKLLLSPDEARYVFGLSSNALLNSASKNQRLLPIERPSLALLIRYLNKHPDRVPVPERLMPKQVYQAVGGGQMKRFSLQLGMEGAAAHRWMSKNKKTQGAERMTATVERLSRFMIEEFDNRQEQEWIAMVEGEARSRGISDIWRAGSWTTAEEKSRKSIEAARSKILAKKEALERLKIAAMPEELKIERAKKIERDLNTAQESLERALEAAEKRRKNAASKSAKSAKK